MDRSLLRLAVSVEAECLRLRGCELLVGEGAASVKLSQLIDLLYRRVLGRTRRLLRRRRRRGVLRPVLGSLRSALAALIGNRSKDGGPHDRTAASKWHDLLLALIVLALSATANGGHDRR